MAKKRRTSWVVWLRRLVQTAFTGLFFYLFLETVFHPVNRPGGPVTFFFRLDPLIAFNTWLASHTLDRALLLSAATLAVTFLAGRWFCGWVCPFGAIHNLFTSLRRSSAKHKLESGAYNRWQKAKYYGLAAFLGAAILGVNVVGWLDPFSFLYRSIATAVFPAFNEAVVTVFTWIYDVNPGIGPVRVTVVSEPVYDVLRKHVLAVEQPQYFGGLLIGALFVAVVALNLFRARFWCRYVCPLGALLGVVGKNPLVRLRRNEAQCNNCRLCVADCQGGANPSEGGGWKPSECFYCWNCKANCPSQAISFGLGKEKKQDEPITLAR